jgi:hypothetical protein
MEQAKVLYELLQKSNEPAQTTVEMKDIVCDLNRYEEEEEDSDESIESMSDDETIEDADELIVEQVKEVHIDDDTDYNKMSVKSLRDLLTDKGIKTTNKMKKNELISLVTNKKSLVVDLALEEEKEEEEKEKEKESILEITKLEE